MIDKETKQHIILTEGEKTIREQSFFRGRKFEKGYVPVKATNFPAKDFYKQEDLDELTEMGVSYEIKYGEK